MDDYSLRLFPGLSQRPPPRSSSITYYNGVPVRVNGNDLVRAHPIPPTAVPKGRMSVPTLPVGGVHVLRPNEAVTWDPVIGQYRLVQNNGIDRRVVSQPPVGYQTPYGYNFDDFDSREPPSPMVRFNGPPPPPPPQQQQYYQPPPPQQQLQHTPKGLPRSQSFPPPPQEQYSQQQQQQQQQQQYLEQQRREQEERQRFEQQQRQQNEREARDREEHQRQLYEQKQREQNEREARDREARDREARDREARDREARDREAREREAREREVREREVRERELKQKEQFKQPPIPSSNNNNLNVSTPTLIKSNSFHSTPESTSTQQQPIMKRKDLQPLDPPHNIQTIPISTQQKQEKVKQDNNFNVAKEYPIEKKLNNLSISENNSKPTSKITSSENELNQRKRMKSLNELLSTEESYSDSLEKLILYYKLPLESKLNTRELEGVSQSDINALFSNVEALLVISKDLLIKLKYEFSLPQDQQKIGDLYIEKSKEMKLYVAYINNYEVAMDELKKIEEASPKFFKDCQSKYKYSLDIRSLLIMPVQRIPRYELLFREILKYTDKDGPEYQKLLEAHQSIHQINDYINNNKRLRENKDRVVTIANELKGCPDSLFKSSRRWIKEGILDITCSNKKYNGQFNVYLFNDLIVLGKHKTFRSKIIEYFAEINLENSEFKEIPGNPTKFRFISDPEGKKPLIFTFEAENEKIKDSWIKNLKLLDEERKLSNISPR